MSSIDFGFVTILPFFTEAIPCVGQSPYVKYRRFIVLEVRQSKYMPMARDNNGKMLLGAVNELGLRLFDEDMQEER
jgi:hypothetical protein